ncbi:MAG: phosphoglycerate dehydrogenase [Desulfobacterales bacterium]|nr:phosphoglycerate dehydrogenase [Desulfobacterales bacterium]
MRVLVSDNLGQVGIEMLEAEDGIEVDVRTGLAPAELAAIIEGYDGLIIRSATSVTEDLLAIAPRLKVVGRAGIGLDNVDIPAATRHGVVVMNTPDGNVITTAEHAIAMLMALARNVPQGTASLRAGRWDKKLLQGQEICGKTLGVIGFGKIGSIVADRARGLRLKVLVHDPHVTPERIAAAGFEAVGLEGLYHRSDFISIHVPKLKETIGLIDRTAFAQMKDGVRLINCARGGIVVEDDLYAAMAQGKVAGAALDVFEAEPPGDAPLIALERLICTPHLGAATQEAQTNVAVAVVKQIIAFLKGGVVVNAVNAPSVTGDLLVRLRPFLKLGAQIGCLLPQLVTGPIKEVAITYSGDFQGLDMSPVTTAILKGILTPTVKDVVNSVNAAILAKGRGIRVTATASSESDEFLYLVTVRLVTTEMESQVAGTIYGKTDSRIVRINKFRLEMIPMAHMALIHNVDRPGAIGSIGTTLGRHDINIGRMQVGQEEEGNRNIVFLSTDTAIPPAVLEELRQLPLVKTVTPLEFLECRG